MTPEERKQYLADTEAHYQNLFAPSTPTEQPSEPITSKITQAISYLPEELASPVSQFVKGASWNYIPAVTPQEPRTGWRSAIDTAMYLAGMGTGLMPINPVSKIGAIVKGTSMAAKAAQGALGAGALGAVHGLIAKPEEGQTRFGQMGSEAVGFGIFGGAGKMIEPVLAKGASMFGSDTMSNTLKKMEFWDMYNKSGVAGKPGELLKTFSPEMIAANKFTTGEMAVRDYLLPYMTSGALGGGAGLSEISSTDTPEQAAEKIALGAAGFMGAHALQGRIRPNKAIGMQPAGLQQYQDIYTKAHEVKKQPAMEDAWQGPPLYDEPFGPNIYPPYEGDRPLGPDIYPPKGDEWQGPTIPQKLLPYQPGAYEPTPYEMTYRSPRMAINPWDILYGTQKGITEMEINQPKDLRLPFTTKEWDKLDTQRIQEEEEIAIQQAKETGQPTERMDANGQLNIFYPDGTVIRPLPIAKNLLRPQIPWGRQGTAIPMGMEVVGQPDLFAGQALGHKAETPVIREEVPTSAISPDQMRMFSVTGQSLFPGGLPLGGTEVLPEGLQRDLFGRIVSTEPSSPTGGGTPPPPLPSGIPGSTPGQMEIFSRTAKPTKARPEILPSVMAALHPTGAVRGYYDLSPAMQKQADQLMLDMQNRITNLQQQKEKFLASNKGIVSPYVDRYSKMFDDRIIELQEEIERFKQNPGDTLGIAPPEAANVTVEPTGYVPKPLHKNLDPLREHMTEEEIRDMTRQEQNKALKALGAEPIPEDVPETKRKEPKGIREELFPEEVAPLLKSLTLEEYKEMTLEEKILALRTMGIKINLSPYLTREVYQYLQDQGLSTKHINTMSNEQLKTAWNRVEDAKENPEFNPNPVPPESSEGGGVAFAPREISTKTVGEIPPVEKSKDRLAREKKAVISTRAKQFDNAEVYIADMGDTPDAAFAKEYWAWAQENQEAKDSGDKASLKNMQAIREEQFSKMSTAQKTIARDLEFYAKEDTIKKIEDARILEEGRTRTRTPQEIFDSILKKPSAIGTEEAPDWLKDTTVEETGKKTKEKVVTSYPQRYKAAKREFDSYVKGLKMSMEKGLAEPESPDWLTQDQIDELKATVESETIRRVVPASEQKEPAAGEVFIEEEKKNKEFYGIDADTLEQKLRTDPKFRARYAEHIGRSVFSGEEHPTLVVNGKVTKTPNPNYEKNKTRIFEFRRILAELTPEGMDRLNALQKTLDGIHESTQNAYQKMLNGYITPDEFAAINKNNKIDTARHVREYWESVDIDTEGMEEKPITTIEDSAAKKVSRAKPIEEEVEEEATPAAQDEAARRMADMMGSTEKPPVTKTKVEKTKVEKPKVTEKKKVEKPIIDEDNYPEEEEETGPLTNMDEAAKEMAMRMGIAERKTPTKTKTKATAPESEEDWETLTTKAAIEHVNNNPDAPDAIHAIRKVGVIVYNTGKTNMKDWKDEMQSFFPKVWGKIQRLALKVYIDIKKKIGNQTGSATLWEDDPAYLKFQKDMELKVRNENVFKSGEFAERWGNFLASRHIGLDPKSVKESDIPKIVDLANALSDKDIKVFGMYSERVKGMKEVINAANELGIDLNSIQFNRGKGFNRTFLDMLVEQGSIQAKREAFRRDLTTKRLEIPEGKEIVQRLEFPEKSTDAEKNKIINQTIKQLEDQGYEGLALHKLAGKNNYALIADKPQEAIELKEGNENVFNSITSPKKVSIVGGGGDLFNEILYGLEKNLKGNATKILPTKHTQYEDINLAPGGPIKDFLKGEGKNNDMIVLNHINIDELPGSKLSPLHSTENWQKAIQDSKADKIVIITDKDTSISGEWLNNLPGFEKVYDDMKEPMSTQIYIRQKEEGLAFRAAPDVPKGGIESGAIGDENVSPYKPSTPIHIDTLPLYSKRTVTKTVRAFNKGITVAGDKPLLREDIQNVPSSIIKVGNQYAETGAMHDAVLFINEALKGLNVRIEKVGQLRVDDSTMSPALAKALERYKDGEKIFYLAGSSEPMSFTEFGHVIKLAMSAYGREFTDREIVKTAAHESAEILGKLLTQAERTILKARFSGGNKAWQENFAEAFADWVDGKRNMDKESQQVKTTMGKIRAFLQRIWNGMVHRGFRSVEDIFSDMADGTIASRASKYQEYANADFMGMAARAAELSGEDFMTPFEESMERMKELYAKTFPKSEWADQTIGWIRKGIGYPFWTAMRIPAFKKIFDLAEGGRERSAKFLKKYLEESFPEMPQFFTQGDKQLEDVIIQNDLDPARTVLSKEQLAEKGLNETQIATYYRLHDATSNAAMDRFRGVVMSKLHAFSDNDWFKGNQAENGYDGYIEFLFGDHREGFPTFLERFKTDYINSGKTPSQAEVAANEMEKMHNLDMMSRLVPRIGEHGELLNSKGDVVNTPEEALQTTHLRAEVLQMKNLLQHTFYFPRMRGDGSYYTRIVRFNKTKPDAEGETIWRENTWAAMFDHVERKQWGELRDKAQTYLDEFKADPSNNPDQYEFVIQNGDVEKMPIEVTKHVTKAALQNFALMSMEKLKDKNKMDEEDLKTLSNDLMNQVRNDILAQSQIGSRSIPREYFEGNSIAGYEKDVKKAYAQYFQMMAHTIAKLHFTTNAMSALQEISPTNQKNLWLFANKYIKDQLAPQTTFDKRMGYVKNMGFAWYLGFNLKSALVQLTQNPIVGLGFLAREISGTGGSLLPIMSAKAERVMLKAGKDIFGWQKANKLGGTSSALNEEEVAMMNDLIKSSVADDQYMQWVMGVTNSKSAGVYHKLIRYSSYLFSQAETLNRQIAGLSMYRVAREKGMNVEQATQKAKDFIYQTHFAMGDFNLPSFARGGSPAQTVANTLMLFRGFTGNFIEAMLYSAKNTENGNLALDVAFRSLAYLAVFGGLSSLPFVDDLLDMYETHAPQSVKKAWGTDSLRRSIRQMIGNENPVLQDGILRGLPAVLGVDISASLSPVGVPLKPTEPGVKGFLGGIESTITGPYGGMADKVGRALDAMDTRDLWRGGEAVAPAFIENVFKSIRLATEGATTMGGRRMYNEQGKQIQLTPGEAALQSIGLKPIDYSKTQELARTTQNVKTFWADRKRTVVSQFVKAIHAQSESKVRSALERMNNLNERLYQYGGAVPFITGETLKSALKEKPNLLLMKEAGQPEPERMD